MATMPTGYIDKDEAVAGLRRAAADLVSVMRGVADVDAPAIGTWSVRDVMVHLGDALGRRDGLAEGRATPFSSIADIGSHNQKMVEADPERDPNVLADRVERSTGRYLDNLDRIDGDPIVRFADIELPVSAIVAIDIAECLVHGYDITHAEKREWRIDPYLAGLSAKGISPMTVHYVDEDTARGLNARFDLRLRGQWQMHYSVADGQLIIEEPTAARVDVHISADPVAFMLVGYGRVSQWGPMLAGKLLAWGRNPLLALKFAKLFRNP